MNTSGARGAARTNAGPGTGARPGPGGAPNRAAGSAPVAGRRDGRTRGTGPGARLSESGPGDRLPATTPRGSSADPPGAEGAGERARRIGGTRQIGGTGRAAPPAGAATAVGGMRPAGGTSVRGASPRGGDPGSAAAVRTAPAAGGQVRPVPSRSGQARTRPAQSGRERSVPARSGPARSGLAPSGPARSGAARSGAARRGAAGGAAGPARAREALGRYGEDLAARRLREMGMAVLERNWRCAEGEIDLIARDGDAIVICEVKTRRAGPFQHPMESLPPAKTARLRRLAARWLSESWLARYGRPPVGGVRLDLVGIVLPHRGAPVVQHVRGVG